MLFYNPFTRVGTQIFPEIQTDVIVASSGLLVGTGAGQAQIGFNTGFITLSGAIITTGSLGLRMTNGFAWTVASNVNTIQPDGSATNISLTANSRRVINAARGTTTTAGGATAVVASVALADNTVTTIRIYLNFKRSGVDEGGYIEAAVTYRRSGATVTVIGALTTLVNQRDDATAGLAAAINGTSIDLQVTSPAAKTYDWSCQIDTTVRGP